MKRSLPLLSTVACSAAVAIPLFVGAPAYAATACADLAKLALPETKITLAERVPAGEFTAPGVQQPLNVPALCRVAGHGRAGDQLRGVAARGQHLERPLPSRRRRRSRRHHQLSRDGRGRAQRLCLVVDGHGPRLDRHRVAARSPTHHRLRLSRDSRDDGEGESRHRNALRARGRVLVLQRLLDGRPARSHDGAALPRRLRRHRLGRAGVSLHEPAHGPALDVACDVEEARCRAHARGFHARRRSGRRAVRCARRSEGRHHHRSQHVQLRSEQAARLPPRADRSAEDDLPRRGESAHGSADLSRPRARRRRRRSPAIRVGA